METSLLPVRGETWTGDIILIEEDGRWSWVLMTGMANVKSGTYLSFENAIESILAAVAAKIFIVPGWNADGRQSLRVFLRAFFLGGCE